MGLRATLALLLLFVAEFEAAEVEFSGETVTMTCPENGTWFKKKGEAIGYKGKTYDFQYNSKNKGLYFCEYPGGTEESPKKITYYFYVKGKACKNCFELDAEFVLVAIVMDVVWTTIVMLIIYWCTKKKTSARLTPTSTAPVRSGGRSQPAQSSHYEPLNIHTRSEGAYSVVNRMG